MHYFKDKSRMNPKAIQSSSGLTNQFQKGGEYHICFKKPKGGSLESWGQDPLLEKLQRQGQLITGARSQSINLHLTHCKAAT